MRYAVRLISFIFLYTVALESGLTQTQQKQANSPQKADRATLESPPSIIPGLVISMRRLLRSSRLLVPSRASLRRQRSKKN